ncbi:hypothetical protein L873DRAFT_1711798 [Choiromyces venosus 120613-1]|uniref:pH-response regulator protein palC n=1 Tax=Choiromyces venosus 120613-1 TaxID=1336337 RepID=A0A3N4JDY7_9PEZI|nr:hypothetical protein L873DRAFT_1711798 [Choiromyces venosus 120613-1]
MPFPYTLPTTSTISYPAYFDSPLYPTLPLATSSHRGSLRNALKAHKRLSTAAAQAANIPFIIKQLESYLAHLLALYDTLTAGDAFFKDGARRLNTSWRAVLSARRVAAKEPPRIARPGLSYEIFWGISTLGYAYTLFARSQLRSVLAPTQGGEGSSSSSSGDAAAAAANSLNQATANLFTSASIFQHLLTRPLPPHASSWPPDLSLQVLSALSSLSLSAATLSAVTKQDPYPSYLALIAIESKQGGGKNKRGGGNEQKSKEWLYNPPAAPSGVRALLIARLCVAASDHAAKALGLLSTAEKSDAGKISEELLRYADSLRRVSRAKACRFLGIDAEAAGRVGEGISWIRGAKTILYASGSSSSSASAVGSLLRRKDEVWGADAGKLDEEKTLDALEARWEKLNDSVMFQKCPDVQELMGRIPTGRELHQTIKSWEPPKLDVGELRALRAAGNPGAEVVVEEEDSEEDTAAVGVDDGGDYAGRGGYY